MGIAFLAVLSERSEFIAGPLAADKPLKADKPGDPPKGPPGRKQRAPAPPMKDLRLKDEEEPAEERILQALSKPTEVNFVDIPLEDAVNFLKEQHKINIWVDRQSLGDANIALDQPVTLQLSDVRFESVLNLILDSLRLEWLIQDEVLKITTHDGAVALAETRSFDVQSLLDAGHTPTELIEAIVQCVEPRSWTSAGGKGAISHSGGVLVCRQTQRVQSAVAMLLLELEELAEEQLEESSAGGAPVVTLKVYHTFEFSAEELAKALQSLVAPDTWGMKGISVRPIKGALLVQQTPHVHREIERILKQLLVHEHPSATKDVPGGNDALPQAPAKPGRDKPADKA
jgi:type II secretory pathway component GspD/PulD (secretin)